jgi:hypothetical protein
LRSEADAVVAAWRVNPSGDGGGTVWVGAVAIAGPGAEMGDGGDTNARDGSIAAAGWRKRGKKKPLAAMATAAPAIHMRESRGWLKVRVNRGSEGGSDGTEGSVDCFVSSPTALRNAVRISRAFGKRSRRCFDIALRHTASSPGWTAELTDDGEGGFSCTCFSRSPTADAASNGRHMVRI